MSYEDIANIDIILNLVKSALDTNIIYIDYNGDTSKLLNRMLNWVKFWNGIILEVYTEAGIEIKHRLLKQIDGFDKKVDTNLISGGGYGGDGVYIGVKYLDGNNTKYILGISRYANNRTNRTLKIQFDDITSKIYKVLLDGLTEDTHQKIKEILKDNV